MEQNTCVTVLTFSVSNTTQPRRNAAVEATSREVVFVIELS